MKAITQRFATRVGQFGLGVAALLATHAAMAVKDLPTAHADAVMW